MADTELLAELDRLRRDQKDLAADMDAAADQLRQAEQVAHATNAAGRAIRDLLLKSAEELKQAALAEQVITRRALALDREAARLSDEAVRADPVKRAEEAGPVVSSSEPLSLPSPERAAGSAVPVKPRPVRRPARGPWMERLRELAKELAAEEEARAAAEAAQEEQAAKVGAATPEAEAPAAEPGRAERERLIERREDESS